MQGFISAILIKCNPPKKKSHERTEKSFGYAEGRNSICQITFSAILFFPDEDCGYKHNGDKESFYILSFRFIILYLDIMTNELLISV